MSKITIKQLAALEAKLKAELHAWALLDAKASKSLRSKTRNGLAIAKAEEAFKDLRKRVIQYAGVLVLGEDSSDWGGGLGSIQPWLKQLRSNGSAFAAAFDLAADDPYEAVFANAEGRKPR